MHFQSRNQFRERDHRISLMPLESDWQDGDLSWLGALLCGLSAVSVILGIAWAVAECMA